MAMFDVKVYIKGIRIEKKRGMIGNLGYNFKKSLYRFLLGILVGHFLGKHFLPPLTSRKLCSNNVDPLSFFGYQGEKRVSKRTGTDESSIYIGMMSMESRMDSRVEAAINTWAKQPNVKVEIFAKNNGTFDKERRYTESFLKNGIRVIQLAGVLDNVYPPQKKSFSMWKFMHDMYLNKYDWFVRLDDDAYIDIDKLRVLLSRVNSSRPLYLGRAGFGKHRNDFIKKGDNFCMGGPGIVFSKGLLRKLAPKLKNCLRNLMTPHEDVELGRCVRRVTGIQCVMSSEFMGTFIQNYEHGKSTDDIKTVSPQTLDQGISFHSNKNPAYQLNFHVMILKRRIQKLITRVILLDKEVRRSFTDEENDLVLAANSYSQFIWDANILTNTFKLRDKEIKKEMHPAMKKTLAYNNNVFVRKMQKQNKFYLRMLKDVSLLSSYFVVNPLFSTDVISKTKYNFSPGLMAKIFRQQKKSSVMYIHQRQYFLNGLQFFKESQDIDIPMKDNEPQQTIKTKYKETDRALHLSRDKVTVNFLTALSGRPDNFVRFVDNLETTFFSQKENVNLIVVYFPQPDIRTTKRQQDSENEVISADSLNVFDQEDANKVNDDIKSIKENMDKLRQRYPERVVKLITLKPGTEFSRGVGLQTASEEVVDPDEILFFCDIDLVFSPSILTHIRRNTIQTMQVYYPVFFSQYDPDVVYVKKSKPSTDFSFNERDGFWRYSSYGMLTIYKSDFAATKGFDTTIYGRGLEDLRMVKTIIGARLNIFRSPEPGQVHIYHDKYCDPGTSEKQYGDCLKSRASHFGPKTLLYYLYKASIKNAN